MPEIYALYGSSGTGKSHRAINIAYKYGIEVIIDDGLLIYRGKKVKGSISGKEEDYKLKAVKRAIFEDKEYREKSKQKLQELDAEKILVIGTSSKMIDRIVENLDLSRPNYWINIDQVTSLRERNKAKTERNKGRHVVPISPVEVLQSFKIPLLDRLKLVRSGGSTDKYLNEQSVVKPRYHYFGTTYLRRRAIQDLATIYLNQHGEIAKLNKVEVNFTDNNRQITGYITLHLTENPINETAERILTDFKANMKTLTGISDLELQLIVSGLDIDEEQPI